MIKFYLATSDDDYQSAAELFRAYAAFININLDFQHFEEELEGLKKMYAPPQGGIILVEADGQPVGCVAIRKISDSVGELKRMFLVPGYQQQGIGKQLLEKALLLAKECQYEVIKLDTLNYMSGAIHLYKQAGFYEIAPYYHNPIETAMYFEKML